MKKGRKNHRVITIVISIMIIIAVYLLVQGIGCNKAVSEGKNRLTTYNVKTAHLSYGDMTYVDEGNGPVILSVHGIFGGYDQAYDTCKDFQSEYRILAPSRFGYLGSDVLGAGTPKEQARAYAELLECLGIDKVFVLGTSAGGSVAIRFALDYPERTAGLILYCSAMPHLEQPKKLPEYAGPPAFLCNDYAMYLLRPFFEPIMGMAPSTITSMVPISERKAGVLLDAAVTNPDMARSFSEYPIETLQSPTLILHAKDDKLASYEEVTKVLGRFPDARFVSFEDGGHLMVGHEEEVRSSVSDFIKENTQKEDSLLEPNIEKIAALFRLTASALTAYPQHEGGRNIVYHSEDTVIRISKATDRSLADQLAETEYVKYLAQGGANSVDVLTSVNGKLVERVDGSYVSAFTLAKGDQIAEHGYQYRAGVPLSEYFYNTGKVLGKMHALSKNYQPQNPRFDFFDKYNESYFDELIPAEYEELKKSLAGLLGYFRTLSKSKENYGMVHFDFSDGNYNIDYDTGKITVFDFENCRTFFYLYDLANLWTHGVGWIAYEADKEKRKAFMKKYFDTILKGYRSETEIDDDWLTYLPQMIQAVLMENIIDEFEVQRAETGGFEEDEEMRYRMECMVRGIEYMGFFDEIYQPEHPFQTEN